MKKATFCGLVLMAICLIFFASAPLGHAQGPFPPDRLAPDGSSLHDQKQTGPTVVPVQPGPRRLDPGLADSTQVQAATLVQYYLPVTDPINLLLDPAGDIWFTAFDPCLIGHLSTGTLEVHSYQLPTGSNPWAIERDQSGKIWTGSVNADHAFVAQLDPTTGAVLQWTMPSQATIFGLVPDPTTGDIWFLTQNPPAVNRLSPATNVVTSWSTAPYGSAYDLALDGNHNIWLTSQPGTQGVLRLTPATGELTAWELPVGTSRPFRLFPQTADAIWISEMDPSGNALARLSPSTNQLHEYRLPVAGTTPTDLWTDGTTVWADLLDGNSLARLDVRLATPLITTLLPATLHPSVTTATMTKTSYMATMTSALATKTTVQANAMSTGGFSLFVLPAASGPWGLAPGSTPNQVWFTANYSPYIGRLDAVPTYLISGKVTDSQGHGISDVTMSIPSGKSVTTNAAGQYAMDGLTAGTYMLKAEKVGFTFSPATRTLSVPPDAAAQDFQALPSTYSISGKVTDAKGAGIGGVTISIPSGRSVTTAAGTGEYRLGGLSAGAYMVQAEKSGYTFSPATKTATVPPDQSDINFTGTLLKLKLLFVPLHWQGTQQAFEAAVANQSGIFLAGVPLGSCQNQVQVTTLDVSTQNFSGFTCSSNDCAVDSVADFARNDLKLNTAAYDVIVGVAESSPCAPIMGCSNSTDTIWVTTQYDSVTAHELGHIFGLADQYCSTRAGSTDARCNDGDSQGDGATTGTVNWLDAALPYDCPPDGSADSGGGLCCNFGGNSCKTVNYGVCCEGNKNASGGRSTMSYANAAGPRGFDGHDMARLNTISKLTCDPRSTSPWLLQPTRAADGDQSIVDVSLSVGKDNSVSNAKVLITTGRPTDGSVLQGMSGQYALQIEDGAGAVLWRQMFELRFDYNGPVALGAEYSTIDFQTVEAAFRIPFTLSMRTLQLYHDSSLIFSTQLEAPGKIYLPLLLR
jgi:streptogramin lyase